MTTINLIDDNTGRFLSVDVDNPSGSLYITDANTGKLFLLDLSNPSGIVYVNDPVTGKLVAIDYSNPTGVFHVTDAKTGVSTEIDLSSPDFSIYVIEESTGDFILLGNSGGGNSTFHLVFDGVNDKITVPHSTSLNNLPSGDFTVEWAGDFSSFNPGTNAPIFEKLNGDGGGWLIDLAGTSTHTLDILCSFDAWNAYYDYGIPIPGGNNHIEIVWQGSTKTALFFVNGILTSQTVNDTVSGSVYDDDSAGDLLIGGSAFNEWAIGRLNWARISNIARHTSNFTPPSLTECPAADANTVLRYALDEGSGTTATDTSGHNNNGTISGAAWEAD